MAVQRGVARRVEVLAVLALCAFGAALRVPGLTSRDLWFDDAWAALPAHVSFTDAVHMVVTTPVYTLALSLWIRVLPQDTWWAQLPALVLGVAGIAAVYALVRFHGFPRLGAAAAAAVIAAGPITVTYSTRVKEYSADLLLACLVLWLIQRWRNDPSRRGLVLLAASSIAALCVSASTAAVVGGAAVAAVGIAWSRRDLRRDVAVYVLALAVSAAIIWVAFLRRLPAQLRTNWRTHGYLFGYSSTRHVVFNFQQTFSGIAHGLFGTAIPFTFHGYAFRVIPMTLAIVTVLALVALVVPPLLGVLRTRGASSNPMVAAAATVAVAVLGTVVGASPLGDGRTDESLYPAILLLVIGAVTAFARRMPVKASSQGVARVGVAAAIGVGAVWFGVSHVAEYPPTGLRSVVAALDHRLERGDVILVDGYESFTWGDENLRPWAVSFAQGAVPWPMGFHVASRDPYVLLSSNYLQPDASIATLSHLTHRVWFIGPTVGGYSTSAPRDLWIFPFTTPTLAALQRLPGWHSDGVCCSSSGTYAELFVYR